MEKIIRVSNTVQEKNTNDTNYFL